MKPAIHCLLFPGAILQRGFWLYVWEITPADGSKVLYVGMTGDTGSYKAQSPFIRVSQHLGQNVHANALRRYLASRNIEPSTCKSFELFALGPLYEPANSALEHSARRNVVAALEKCLRDALVAAGYDVLNQITCRQPLDERQWQDVLEAFSGHFNKLNSRSRTSQTRVVAR